MDIFKKALLWLLPIVGGFVLGIGLFLLFDGHGGYIACFAIAGGVFLIALCLWLIDNRYHLFISWRDFLELVHIYFDELGYHFNMEDFDYEVFFKKAINTINHTKDLDDTVQALESLQFIDMNISAFIKKAYKHLDYWNSIKWSKKSSFDLYKNDEEVSGTYFISDAWFGKIKEFSVSSVNIDEPLLDIQYENGRYSCYGSDSIFYLRDSKTSLSKMVIEDKDGNKRLVILLNKDFTISFENNSLPFVAKCDANLIWLLKNTDDIKESTASIEWNMLNKKNRFGVSRLELYEDISDDEIELLILLATSCLLLFHNHIKDKNIKEFSKGLRIGANASVRNRRR